MKLPYKFLVAFVATLSSFAKAQEQRFTQIFATKPTPTKIEFGNAPTSQVAKTLFEKGIFKPTSPEDYWFDVDAMTTEYDYQQAFELSKTLEDKNQVKWEFVVPENSKLKTKALPPIIEVPNNFIKPDTSSLFKAEVDQVLGRDAVEVKKGVDLINLSTNEGPGTGGLPGQVGK